MKKIVTIVYILFFMVSIGMAQKNKIVVSAGPSMLIPTYSEIKSAGFGLGACIEFNFNKKILFASDIDINIFNSNVKNIFTDKITNGFIVMPLLVGVKWNAFNNIYFSGKAGVVKGLKNAGTSFSLSPGVDYRIHMNGKQKFNVGLKLVGVLATTSFSENSFLEKGGYSFLSLGLAYML